VGVQVYDAVLAFQGSLPSRQQQHRLEEMQLSKAAKRQLAQASNRTSVREKAGSNATSLQDGALGRLVEARKEER
jgi:hypothetical protein